MNPISWVILIICLTAITCALSGFYLVLRKRAMIADAISHSVLPGLVAGFYFANGPNLLAGFVGAVFAGLVTVFAVEKITSSTKIKEDSAIGLVFPAMFAIGVIWISLQFSNVHLDTDAVLFGEITLAPFSNFSFFGTKIPQSIPLLLLSLGLNIGFLTVFSKELKVSTFDPTLAKLQNFNPKVINYCLMAIVAVTTVAAFTAVGAILTVALVVVPTVVASLFTTDFKKLLLLSVACAIGAALLGTSIAVISDYSISGLVATMLGLAFGFGILFAPHRGAISRQLKVKEQRIDFAVSALLIHLQAHQGQPEEREESNIEHLQSELGWDPVWINKILEKSQSKNLVQVTEKNLSLTQKGILEANKTSSIYASPKS